MWLLERLGDALATSAAMGWNLIVIPLLLIYRKYYGTAAMLRIAGIFYLAMVIAGYAVELLFLGAGLVPETGGATVIEPSFKWDYTTWLNLGFLAVAAALLIRFFGTGGREMLRRMGGEPESTHEHGGRQGAD